MTDREILDFIPPGDFQMPNGEWIEPLDFISEVREATRVGEYTFDSIVDSFTHCFAVPVFDTRRSCVATLCLVVPRKDGISNRQIYLDCLKRASHMLSGPVDLQNRRTQQAL